MGSTPVVLYSVFCLASLFAQCSERNFPATLQQDLLLAFEFSQQADLQNPFKLFQFSNFRNTFSAMIE